MLLDIEQNESSLILSYFNESGKTDYKVYDKQDTYNWVICSDDDRRRDRTFKNWDGRSVKKLAGRNLNKHSLTTFIETLSEEDAAEVFSDNYPSSYFFDIETEVTDEPFDQMVRNASSQVLTISLVTPEQKVIVMGLKDLSPKESADIESKTNEYFKDFSGKWQFIYRKFKSEYDMLYTFMTTVSKLPFLSGWNCVGFDWVYLVNRCRRLQIDPTIASPTGKLQDAKNKYLPYHVGLIDYMDLYANWDRSIKIKENYKLETAAKQVLGLGKIKYDGGFQELYKDFSKYVYYNAVDSILVYYIDQKLSTMQLVMTLSNICKISIYKAASPVAITEAMIARNLLKEDKLMVRDYNEEKESKSGQYTGAFVKEPIRGKHKGVACFDFASLYPSIMRQFNISPDSFLEKVPASRASEKREETKDKCIVTENGCVYRSEDSILKKVLTDLYSKRKEYKKKSFEYKMKVAAIKDRLKKL